MSFRYSPTNVLAAATLTAPTQAAGYSASAVVDGQVGVLARSVAATTHTYLFDRLVVTPSPPIAMAAVFGVRSTTLGPSNILQVAFEHASVIGGPYSGSLITLNSRGDGWVSQAASDRYVHLLVTLSVADTVDIGEIWAGTLPTLTRSPMGPLARGITYPTKVNDAEDGSIYTSRVADYFEDWDFRWGTLSAAHAAEVLAMYQGQNGPLNPLVIVPDTIGGEVFHGHFTPPRLPRNIDTPVVTGLQLAFRQSGRAVYA